MRTWRMWPFLHLEIFRSEQVPAKKSGIGTESGGIPEFRSEGANKQCRDPHGPSKTGVLLTYELLICIQHVLENRRHTMNRK